MKVFSELTTECDITAQMYAHGFEKKEIADIKCRAISTVSNQLQTAFKVLHVNNGRELAVLMCERITGVRITMDYGKRARSILAMCLLGLFLSSLRDPSLFDMRRARQQPRTEYRIKD